MKKRDNENRNRRSPNVANVRAIIDYYDRQSDDESAAEILAAPEAPIRWMRAPSSSSPPTRRSIRRRRKRA
jgi:hypothetical protein